MQKVQKQDQRVMRLMCSDKTGLEEKMDQLANEGWKPEKIQIRQGWFVANMTMPNDSKSGSLLPSS
jgi:hypothetical protein